MSSAWSILLASHHVLLLRLDAAPVRGVHGSDRHGGPGVPLAPHVPVPGPTLPGHQGDQDLAGDVREVHPGRAHVSHHLHLRGLRLGVDRPLGVDGLHGDGPLCRVYCFCQAAQSEGVHIAPDRPPALRCLLGIFLTGNHNLM